MSEITRAQLLTAMQRWGFLEDPAPDAALRWIDTFLEAYGDRLAHVDDAFTYIADLRAESCVIPALELERLRTRSVLFFLDSVGQYIDHQPELRGLPLAHDIPAIGAHWTEGRATAGAALSAARSRPDADSDRCGQLAPVARSRPRTDQVRPGREPLRNHRRAEAVRLNDGRTASNATQ
jgi:hypothetical protein